MHITDYNKKTSTTVLSILTKKAIMIGYIYEIEANDQNYTNNMILKLF